MRKQLLAVLLFLLVLSIFQASGILESVFGSATTATYLVNSIVVIVVGVILAYITNKTVKDQTIRKIIHYLIFAAAALTIFFIFQENLVAVGISLGIIAVVFTLIFQSPILNLVGWVYITIGRVYSEGDRIRVGN